MKPAPRPAPGGRGRLLRFEPGAYRAVGVECEGRFARVGAGGYGGRRAGAGNHRAGRFRTHAGPFPPCGGHPAHVRCGKRRSCSGRVHRLSRQPGPGRGGHRQLRGHGHPAAHLLCAGIPRVLAGSGAARLSGKRREPRLRGRGIPAARRGRSGQYALSVHRLGLRRRGAPGRKTAPRRALPRGRGRRDASAAGAGCAGRSAARETLEDAVCLAALERRFGAALRDGAQPGEASAQACGTICAAR